MSTERLRFPAASSPPPPGAAKWFPASEPAASPPLPGEMEPLRLLVNQRLAAAVDDILQLFGTTVNRYRKQIDQHREQVDRYREQMDWYRDQVDRYQEQIDRQQRQLDSLKPKEENQEPASNVPQVTPVQLRPENHLNELPADVKMEDCGDSDVACDAANDSDTDDSADYCRTDDVEAEGHISFPGGKPSPDGPPGLCCKICGEAFLRLSSLLSHAAAHVTDCSVCGEHLDAPKCLEPHLLAHRKAAFRCGVCGQTFTLRGNLRMHMRIHSGERPFACTVCDKSFGRRATLVRHVRSHTGEKPFICSYCGRGFVEKGNLTVHLRTHTGEKPYSCATCDRRFNQLSCFYKHPCQRRHLTADPSNT